MNKEKLLAGIDAGHINTKAVIMREQEILSYCAIPTAFDVHDAAQTALSDALENAGITYEDLDGVIATGIFKDMVEIPSLEVTSTVPEYMADAKGALFLNKDSRTVIDIGGNIHKAIYFDQNGNLIDVTQNDKCADGLGIFYTTMSKALGLSEQEMSELALRSTKDLSIAIQCALSAETDAVDLICQGRELPDVASAVAKFVAERVADMSTYMPLTQDVVIAGGLAKSQPVIKHLKNLLKKDLSPLKYPEYVGAIGAVIGYEGKK